MNEHNDPDLRRAVPRRPLWKLTLAGAGVAAALSWIALWPQSPAGDEPEGTAHVLVPAPSGSPPAAAGEPSRADAPPAAPAGAAPGALSAAEDARDLRALESDNSGDRIEALRSIRARGSAHLVPRLLAHDPARDPEAAPTLIGVVAELAQQLGDSERAAAAAQLGDWLERESRRATADARGNVSVLVEALGRVSSPASVQALVRALDSRELPLHVATLAARGLAQLGDAGARDTMERFRQRISGASAADGLERELYAEALATADSALARWPR